jgi:adenylate cyclase
MLMALSQADRKGDLTDRVRDLPLDQFRDLLDQITAEFEHFLRAIDLVNHESLEILLDQILEAFTLKIGQILRADRTTIFLVDREKEQLWSKIAQGTEGKQLEIHIPLSTGIAGHVAQTGNCLNLADAYRHPLFNPDIDRQTGYQTRNLLCMPIFDTKQQVVAVVQLLNKLGELPFDASDEQLFKEFAVSIGIILESCHSFYIAARNQRGVVALLKATSSLGQSLDLDKTLQVVMDEARDLMQADRSTLFLLDRERGELWSKVATADGNTMMEIRIPADRGIAGYVASTGQTLNIPNAYEDPRFDPTVDCRTGYRTHTILCMPVYNSASFLIGVTQLINKHQGRFTTSDEEFMRAFNIQAGVALENAQLFETVLLEKQYQKDILQSLSNAVISTDMQGKIVTINDAALELLGCPSQKESGRHPLEFWRQMLVGRLVWEVVPIENLQTRLNDSLSVGARHYVPEQSLSIGLYSLTELSMLPAENAAPDLGGGSEAGAEDNISDRSHPIADSHLNADPMTDPDGIGCILAIRDRTNADYYIPWNQVNPAQTASDGAHSVTGTPLPLAGRSPFPAILHRSQIQDVERSINLTVNPLTNPEGQVRGGLVVLEDISQEKRMKATLYRYMTPGVAEQVMALGDDVLMVGERRDVSILFSDIRSYTSLTEKMEAADVVSLLNNYFETMVEAVFTFEGTLDKFIGDALMAVFGAPLPLENHAWMAVQSALDMRRRLAEFNHRRHQMAQPQIRIGIGISSGEVVSGNIGSQKRMDYTVIGDGVDISSRLEGVTKQYGCDIILSEFTYKLCWEKIWVRELDRIRVKGKTKPILIYELLGDRRAPLAPDLQEFLEVYQAGRSAYMMGNFNLAIQQFERALRLRKGDRAIAIHLERAHSYLRNPPPERWDGVYTMTTK